MATSFVNFSKVNFSGGMDNGKDRARPVSLYDQESDDRFFIAAMPAGENGIKKIQGDLLGFDLHPGAMQEEAQLIAEMLNRHIASILLTIFP
jgi:hypothetical protein